MAGAVIIWSIVVFWVVIWHDPGNWSLKARDVHISSVTVTFC